MVKNEIDFIKIVDSKNNIFIGGNQYWLKNKFHSISGCGPTTASEILTYIAKKNGKQLLKLYDYDINTINKEDFMKYIVNVRNYVKPGIKGLTDIDYYDYQVKSFASDRGIKLNSKKLTITSNIDQAFDEIVKTIDSDYPLAMLILKNPHPDINDFTWHWMTIIGYNKEDTSIKLATHGKTFVLNFKNIWLNDPRYVSELVWFKPEGI